MVVKMVKTPLLFCIRVQMDVSENSGFSSQIIHFNRVFHYFHHPFGGFYPYFWKHPDRVTGHPMLLTRVGGFKDFESFLPNGSENDP